jgi:hypothetical protein
MTAKDIFTIAKELPKKELDTLMILIKNHLNRLKSSATTTTPIITDIETQNYLLETVFKIKTKGEKCVGEDN